MMISKFVHCTTIWKNKALIRDFKIESNEDVSLLKYNNHNPSILQSFSHSVILTFDHSRILSTTPFFLFSTTPFFILLRHGK